MACVHFQLWSFENYTSKFRPHLCHKILCSFSPSPSPHLLLLQALIHGFQWWWASSWLIFSLKWHLQSSFFLLHFAGIKLQEAKDSIDEECLRPTSSTWSYIMKTLRKENKKQKLEIKECPIHTQKKKLGWE